jgi:hypothetical protein
MIADMQAEIKALQAKIDVSRKVHSRKMSKAATNTWTVESKVREKEKINAFLRQVVMTGQMRPTEVDAINDKAVSSSSGGPEVKTAGRVEWDCRQPGLRGSLLCDFA